MLVLRACDILLGIRIRGSVPLNYRSGFGSGSVCFILLCMVEGWGGKTVFFSHTYRSQICRKVFCLLVLRTCDIFSHTYRSQICRKVFCLLVLRTCDILVGIRIRIRIWFRIRVFYFIVYGGRSGWERTVFFSHTYRSQICRKVFCLLVLRTCDIFSHTYRSQICRKVFCLLVLRTCDILVGIRIRRSVPLNYRSGFGSGSVWFNFIVYGGRAGWERTVFFLHTYRSQICMSWRGGKEQCSVLFAHISDFG
jgi:hypothetical protein